MLSGLLEFLTFYGRQSVFMCYFLYVIMMYERGHVEYPDLLTQWRRKNGGGAEGEVTYSPH